MKKKNRTKNNKSKNNKPQSNKPQNNKHQNNNPQNDKPITETTCISEERLVEIHSEAYYRALKRIEREKYAELDNTASKKERQWWFSILFALNIFLCPFKISKRFMYNKRMYDGLLTMIISIILSVSGFFMWFLGVAGLIYGCGNLHDFGMSIVLFFAICVLLILMGSIFLLAGKTFGEETDSNRIYAFSASILALVGCILSLVSIMK